MACRLFNQDPIVLGAINPRNNWAQYLICNPCCCCFSCSSMHQQVSKAPFLLGEIQSPTYHKVYTPLYKDIKTFVISDVIPESNDQLLFIYSVLPSAMFHPQLQELCLLQFLLSTWSTPRHAVISGPHSVYLCTGLPPDPGKRGVPWWDLWPSWGEAWRALQRNYLGIWKEAAAFCMVLKTIPFAGCDEQLQVQKKTQNSQVGQFLRFFFWKESVKTCIGSQI